MTPHELVPKLRNELCALRSRIARENTVMSQVAADSSAFNAARRRLNDLTTQLQKLEHTERMFVSQAHGS